MARGIEKQEIAESWLEKALETYDVIRQRIPQNIDPKQLNQNTYGYFFFNREIINLQLLQSSQFDLLHFDAMLFPDIFEIQYIRRKIILNRKKIERDINNTRLCVVTFVRFDKLAVINWETVENVTTSPAKMPRMVILCA